MQLFVKKKNQNISPDFNNEPLLFVIKEKTIACIFYSLQYKDKVIVLHFMNLMRFSYYK